MLVLVGYDYSVMTLYCRVQWSVQTRGVFFEWFFAEGNIQVEKMSILERKKLLKCSLVV
jgi:hypothetical protein